MILKKGRGQHQILEKWTLDRRPPYLGSLSREGPRPDVTQRSLGPGLLTGRHLVERTSDRYPGVNDRPSWGRQIIGMREEWRGGQGRRGETEVLPCVEVRTTRPGPGTEFFVGENLDVPRSLY